MRCGGGDLRYENVFAGGNPFAGRELLSTGARPLWAMTCYGRAMHEPRLVFGALRAALRAGPDNGEWCRGPVRHQTANFTYRCDRDGDIDGFTAEESLTADGQEVYGAVVAPASPTGGCPRIHRMPAHRWSADIFEIKECHELRAPVSDGG